MKLLLKEEPYVNDVGNLRMCEAFRMRKGSGMLIWYYVKKKNKQSLTVNCLIYFLNLKIPPAKPGEWPTVFTRLEVLTLALPSERALKENPEMVKIDTLFRPKPLKNHTHWGSTYLGVALSGWEKDVINISHNIKFEIDLSVFIFSIGVSWKKE